MCLMFTIFCLYTQKHNNKVENLPNNHSLFKIKRFTAALFLTLFIGFGIGCAIAFGAKLIVPGIIVSIAVTSMLIGVDIIQYIYLKNQNTHNPPHHNKISDSKRQKSNAFTPLPKIPSLDPLLNRDLLTSNTEKSPTTNATTLPLTQQEPPRPTSSNSLNTTENLFSGIPHNLQTEEEKPDPSDSDETEPHETNPIVLPPTQKEPPKIQPHSDSSKITTEQFHIFIQNQKSHIDSIFSIILNEDAPNKIEEELTKIVNEYFKACSAFAIIKQFRNHEIRKQIIDSVTNENQESFLLVAIRNSRSNTIAFLSGSALVKNTETILPPPIQDPNELD